MYKRFLEHPLLQRLKISLQVTSKVQSRDEQKIEQGRKKVERRLRKVEQIEEEGDGSQKRAKTGGTGPMYLTPEREDGGACRERDVKPFSKREG